MSIKTANRTLSKSSVLNIDRIWIVLVFLFSLNFMNLTNLIFIFFIIIGLYKVWISEARFKFSIDFVLLIMFTFSYFTILIFYKSLGFQSLLVYVIGPILCFFIGYFIYNNKDDLLVNTIFAIVFGNFIHGLLNMFIYFFENGFNINVIGLRTFPDIWQGTALTATLQGTYYSLVASLLFFALLLILSRQKVGIGIIIIFATSFSLFASFIMGNRTLLIILALSTILCLFVYMTLNKLNFKRNAVVLTIISFIIITFFLIYNYNFLGTRTFIESSTLYSRIQNLSLQNDSRSSFVLLAINQLLDYPMGGYKMFLGGGNYVHNLWLDVLYATGIIPFAFLISYTFVVLINLLKIMKNKVNSLDFKVLIFGLNLGFLLTFMVEPILEGVPYLFMSFCLINGMISKKVYINNRV